jgi:ABC-type phosphate/phosphonate transport system substrate-binding protein
MRNGKRRIVDLATKKSNYKGLCVKTDWFKAITLVVGVLLFGAAGAAGVTGAVGAAGAAGATDDLTIGVAEGTSGELDHIQVINKYKGLAEVIGRSIGRKVNVVYVRELSALEDSMKSSRYDLIFARPSDYPARGMKLYGYNFVASADPDGYCYILTPKGSPIKTLQDIRGKRVVLPQAAAYMTKFCGAELRDHGINLSKEKLQYVREQSMIGMYLENNLADVGVGVASFSGMARRWEEAGNTILHKSVAQPYFPLIAAARMTRAQRDAIRKALAEMPNSAADQAVLKTIGIQGFNLNSEQRLRNLLDWLGPTN